ncbi:MAG: ABC transporter substrate-binding protein [bacterium]
MNSKWYLRTLALLLVLLMLAACSGGAGDGQEPAEDTETTAEEPAAEEEQAADEEDEPAEAEEESDEVIELTYWHTNPGPAGDAQDELVEMFNESQDRIHVSTEFQGSYDDLATSILTAFAGGGGPDVSQLGTFEILEFYNSGVLVDLKPYLDGPNGVDTSAWPGTLLSAGEFDGGVYWLPFNVAVPVLYYNQEAFDEAGLDGPPETWEEFYDYARQLTVTDDSGNVERYGVAYIPGWFSWAMTSTIWSEGGEITNKDYTDITLNDPVVVDVLGEFQALIEEEAAVLPDDASGGHRGMFMNGQAAMILDSPAPFGDIFENAVGFTPAVANYPAGEVGREYNPGGGGIAMIASGDEAKRDAAWEFMKFMISPESLAYYAERSGYVAWTPEAQEAAGDLLEDERYATIHEAVPYLRGDFSANFSPAVRTNFDQAWQSIFVEGADPQEALDAADARAEEEIDEEIFAP